MRSVPKGAGFLTFHLVVLVASAVLAISRTTPLPKQPPSTTPIERVA